MTRKSAQKAAQTRAWQKWEREKYERDHLGNKTTAAMDELMRTTGAVDCDGSLDCAAESHIHGCFAAGPFDPDELVRWAERYGHPEGWAKKAQQLHAENERLREEMAAREDELSVANLLSLYHENERLKLEIRTWKQRLVDEQARLRAQIHEDRENAAENCARALDECCHGVDDVCVSSGCQMGIPGAERRA